MYITCRPRLKTGSYRPLRRRTASRPAYNLTSGPSVQRRHARLLLFGVNAVATHSAVLTIPSAIAPTAQACAWRRRSQLRRCTLHVDGRQGSYETVLGLARGPTPITLDRPESALVSDDNVGRGIVSDTLEGSRRGFGPFGCERARRRTRRVLASTTDTILCLSRRLVLPHGFEGLYGELAGGPTIHYQTGVGSSSTGRRAANAGPATTTMFRAVNSMGRSPSSPAPAELFFVQQSATTQEHRHYEIGGAGGKNQMGVSGAPYPNVRYDIWTDSTPSGRSTAGPPHRVDASSRGKRRTVLLLGPRLYYTVPGGATRPAASGSWCSRPRVKRAIESSARVLSCTLAKETPTLVANGILGLCPDRHSKSGRGQEWPLVVSAASEATAQPGRSRTTMPVSRLRRRPVRNWRAVRGVAGERLGARSLCGLGLSPVRPRRSSA